MHRKGQHTWKQLFPFSWRDFLLASLIFLCAVVFCALLRLSNSGDGFASPIFVLAVLLISRLTTGYLYGLVAALLGVVCVNYVFTYPYLALNFTLSGYPLSFLAFLGVSIITSTLTSQAKQQQELRVENEKEKMRANLLRSVSHDIRTPLTSIVGATSTILETPTLSPAEQRDLLEDVRDDAQWLIQVVENLLSITRIGSDPACIHKEAEPAEEILGVAVQKFRKRYPDVSVGGLRSGNAAVRPHGRHPHRAGPVQSSGKRRAPRQNHHKDRSQRPMRRRRRAVFRAGQRPGHLPRPAAHAF